MNDNLGHHAGDAILRAVAVRLKAVIRSSDTISRVGGDEFIIILKHLKFSANVEKIVTDVATSISTTLRTTFTYNGNTMFVGVSIGISIFPDHGTDVDTLINNADLAMYNVKHNGGYGYNTYSSSMNNKSIDKLKMKTKLNNAMSNNEFITYYQPIIDLKSMKISSSEALIRWRQGDTIIPSAEFIPIAKSIGEIVAIDNWMIENACIQCKKWQVLGTKDFSISVNTSYKQLKQLNFVKLVRDILKANLLSPRYLNLEITEDVTLEEPELIIDILTKLKCF
ncbi:putative bifunctional diguanylate cyclase/phosphodiesterase [Clostridium psychrophilum]|uniref:putative bifunctional diguanylate cyclase/phosphodiesterase n=1 Tax=Clostridium psychrophilum TaxID=132926 RepID=UPI0028A9BACF|nr:EAL domain-containing protein [Clostridium psychrophilum]